MPSNVAGITLAVGVAYDLVGDSPLFTPHAQIGTKAAQVAGVDWTTLIHCLRGCLLVGVLRGRSYQRPEF